MAKKTHKQCARSEKDHAGCMSSLISIFDFRQGHYTQRLLSDRRHGSARHAGTGYKGKLNLLTSSEDKHKKIIHDARNEGSINLGPSVKILMEEEMSRVQQYKKMPNADTEQIRHSEASYEKNHCKANETSVLSCDMLRNDKSPRMGVPDKMNDLSTIERFSYNLHAAALLEEFCGDRQQYQRLLMDIKNSTDSYPSQKSAGEILCDFLDQPDANVIQNHSSLHKLLIDMAEVLINQDSNSILREKSHQSEELINALGILNPKELLLKLLQDPSSPLVKRIQEFKNDQEGKSSMAESCEALEEWNVSSRQCEEPVSHKMFQKRNVRNFFRKKDRLQETKVSSENDSAQPLNKIVVLKPTPPRIQNSSHAVSPSTSQSHESLRTVEEKERVTSHFSLKEIKRRLKHVIGDNRKGQHMLSMDGILHIIPYESQPPGNSITTLKDSVQTKSESKISHRKDHASQLSSSLRKKEKMLKLKETRSSVAHEATFQNKNLSMLTASTSPLNKEHNFQQEARKHLVDMLTVVDSDAKSPARQISKSLGRMLSLSEYNMPSPRLSPGREKETSLSPRHPRFSPLWQLKQESGKCLSPSRESIQDSPPIGTTKTLDQLCDSNTNTQRQESISSEEMSRQELLSSGEVSSSTGCMESVEPLDIEHTQEDSVAVLSKSTVGVPTKVVEGSEEEMSLSPRTDSSERSQTVTPLVAATPVTLLVHDIGSPDCIIEKPERPSPVSVLEPLFTEDVSSPVDSTDGHVGFLVQPRHIPFEEQGSCTLVLTISGDENVRKTCSDDKESRFQYVRAVLEAAGLVQDGLLARHSSSPLLSPSLYDEVEYLSDEFPDDLRHLFDSINEVLEVICEKLLSCTPWVSCAQSGVRPIPSGESLIKEVWKGMELHSLSPSPLTLDEIVRKDMEVGTWMDLRSEVDGIGFFMEDAILDDIMEETLLEFWH